MPEQEIFFDQSAGNRRVQVLKTYDSAFAHEALRGMSDEAISLLWNVLKIDDSYDAADLPTFSDGERAEFLWAELVDSAREDWNLLSFFVVSETEKQTAKALFVSPDWPTAEAFATARLQDAPVV